MRYTSIICPGCSQPFGEADDVVVCPVCGTPQHRSCWQKNNNCVNEALHAEGFVWKMPEEFRGKPDSGANKEPALPITCPVCGLTNPPGTESCSGCTAPLGGVNAGNGVDSGNGANQVNGGNSGNRANQVNGGNSGNDNNQGNGGYFGNSFGGFPFPGGFPGGRGNNPYGNGGQGGYSNGTQAQSIPEIDSIPINELATYIGPQAQRYILKFSLMKRSGKNASWNWAAAFLGPFWLFYRKMYKLGALILGIMLIFSVATTSPMWVDYADQSIALMQDYFEGEITQEEFSSQLLNLNIEQDNSFWRNFISSLSTFALCVVQGLFGNLWYLNKAKKDILKARERASSREEYEGLLARKGRISPASILIVIAYYYLETVISYLIMKMIF